MSDVGDFIRHRWPTVQLRINRLNERRRVLEAQAAEVEAELAEANNEAEAIKSAAKLLNLKLQTISEDEQEKVGATFRLYSFGDVSIKQAIRLTLDTFREGLESNDLHAAINRRYFEDKLPRTSFSPQLSRLKRDEEVTHGDKGWILTDKGRSIMAEGKLLPYENSVFD